MCPVVKKKAKTKRALSWNKVTYIQYKPRCHCQWRCWRQHTHPQNTLEFPFLDNPNFVILLWNVTQGQLIAVCIDFCGQHIKPSFWFLSEFPICIALATGMCFLYKKSCQFQRKKHLARLSACLAPAASWGQVTGQWFYFLKPSATALHSNISFPLKIKRVCIFLQKFLFLNSNDFWTPAVL